jgi:ABC-2 type transport system ATP-binding protein
MEEAQRCHQLAFLSAGQKVAEGSPSTIKQALNNASVYSTKIPYLPELRDKLMEMEGMILVNQFGNELRLVVTPDIEQSALQALIYSVTGTPVSLQPSEPNLEDVFIALTQEQPVQP